LFLERNRSVVNKLIEVYRLVKCFYSSYCAGHHLTIADFSILASVTQLEGMEYKITSYPNLHKWVEMLKSELPYYEACNSAGIEMFRAWAKSKNRSYSSKGK